jgi:hypothetical protein
MVQVSLRRGAGVVFAWGPAPQKEHLRAPMAQVPPLFPHLLQQLPTPAPPAQHTCANDYPHVPRRHHTIRAAKTPDFLKFKRTLICLSLH